jgi:acetyl-CoA carboxylase biotin carboxyl carrier protein
MDDNCGETSAADTRALLEAVRLTAVELVTASRQPLQRLAVSAGHAAVELDWATAAPAPTSSGDEAVPSATSTAPGVPHYVRAPIVGTFYVAPEPGARPFVAVDDVVEAGQPIGVVEAMKLMNPVEADCAGRVLEVLVRDRTSVEYDQPLVSLAPIPDLDVGDSRRV